MNKCIVVFMFAKWRLYMRFNVIIGQFRIILDVTFQTSRILSPLFYILLFLQLLH